MDLFLSGRRARKPVFDAARELPSLAGKTIVVTGGTAGLGRETVLAFAAHNPAHIIFTGRSQQAADSVLAAVRAGTKPEEEVRVSFVACDLASMAAVREAATRILALAPTLHLLMANAGVMGVAPPACTRDGFEAHFGTNHVGHALLAHLLLPALQKAAAEAGAGAEAGAARIVWNTSVGYQAAPADGIRFADVRKADAGLTLPGLGVWQRYGQSKLANLLYAREFARHNPGVTSVSVHPGVSATGLISGLGRAQKMFVYATTVGKMLSPEQCAWNQQWAATARVGDGERELQNGGYYEPVAHRGELKGKAADDALAAELWQWTQKVIEAAIR